MTSTENRPFPLVWEYDCGDTVGRQEEIMVRLGSVLERPETSSKLHSAKPEEKAIREQLDSVLASVHFKNSKRYPNLLRYVVTRTLEGKSAESKERTIGVEVLGREPDYDTSTDPAVRITAGEVRKRLVHYYQEAEHEFLASHRSGVRILRARFLVLCAKAAHCRSQRADLKKTSRRRSSGARSLIIWLRSPFSAVPIRRSINLGSSP